MKNLLIYTSREKQFNEEVGVLTKIQIDNSLHFWKPEDIILVTNFDYEFLGVKSLVVPDIYYEPDLTSNKMKIIVYLLQNNLLPEDVIWYHDFDAYQEVPIDLKTELGFVSYGYKKQWNLGSFFFTPKAKPTFELLLERMGSRKNRADEKTFAHLVSTGEIGGFDDLKLEYNYTQAVPEFKVFDHVVPKVVHFHPHYTFYRSKEDNLSIFMYGKNRMNRKLMSERLISIFNNYGVK